MVSRVSSSIWPSWRWVYSAHRSVAGIRGIRIVSLVNFRRILGKNSLILSIFISGTAVSLFLFVCFKFPYLFWISRFPLKLAFGFGGEKDLKYDTTGPFFSVLSKNRCKGVIFLLSFYLKNRHRHTHESA